MPARPRRIAVENDAALEAALEQAVPHFPGRPAAAIVHELALLGAAALEEETRLRRERLRRDAAWARYRW